jgi:hypothetical protein
VSSADGQPLSDDARWERATARAAEIERRGPRVVGPSLQACLFAMTTLFFALTLPLAIAGGPVWQPVVCGFGWAISTVAWVRARRRSTLEPFLPEQPGPTRVLSREQRREMGRQLRGKQPPSPHAVDLIDLVVRRQRESSAHLWPSLVGTGLGVAGAGSLATLLLLAVAAVFILVVTTLERRRWERWDRASATVSDRRRGGGAARP